MPAAHSGPVVAVTPIAGAATTSLAVQAHAEAPSLPSGFPSELNDGPIWTGSDFSDESSYTCVLNPEDKAEVMKAVEHFKARGLDGDLVDPESFPLPNLGPKLFALRHDIHNGKGFAVIRGLDPALFSVEDLTLVWLGIQSYVAEQRGRQDRRGNMLVHIAADNSTKQAAEHHRHSTKPITFHNEESGDVVSWLTRSTAAAGGKCIISSAYTIYNVLAVTRPDVVRTLARSDWPFALPRFQCRPVIFYENSRLIMNFGRAALLGNDAHPRPSHLPMLNHRQIEALDAIEAIARATELEIQTQAGDMHFINNLAILHRRDGFVNGNSPSEKRHLVRMRLRSSKLGWTIPEALQPRWDEAFNKNGPKHWHLEPMPSFFFPLRRHPN